MNDFRKTLIADKLTIKVEEWTDGPNSDSEYITIYRRNNLGKVEQISMPVDELYDIIGAIEAR